LEDLDSIYRQITFRREESPLKRSEMEAQSRMHKEMRVNQERI
jgi:hypothetical protein